VWNSIIGLMVHRWDRKPNCSGGSRLFNSSTCLRRLARIFSRIFPGMFRREIGRYDWGSEFSWFWDHDGGGVFLSGGEVVGLQTVVKDDS
jgi:hypothetical protein